MEIIRTIDWMKQVCRSARSKEHVIGFVPTMGAIHEGHLSLVREAKKRCSPVIVSIFVNPTQFGPGEDLSRYPRPFEADCAKLEALGVDYVFAPTAEEMYPKGFCTSVRIAGIGEWLEGKSRPGHFQGVATVVLKLFEIAQPSFAFFGRKDAQQLAVIHRMVRDLALDVEIVACPIVREADGLAMSSRNVYLKPEARRAALALSRSLMELRKKIEAGERDVVRLLAAMRGVIAAEPEVALDYAEIADAETFEPVVNLRGACYALLATRAGGARLIDNAFVEPVDGVFRVEI